MSVSKKDTTHEKHINLFKQKVHNNTTKFNKNTLKTTNVTQECLQHGAKLEMV